MPDGVNRRDLVVEYRPIDSLMCYARNARTHSDSQVAEIAGSIREFGFTNPVLVAEDGTLIAGHGRVLAARKLGMADVPTIVLAGLSETQRRALVLADNRIAINAGWDNELLALELIDLQDAGFDLGLTGFTGDEIADLLHSPDDDGDDGDDVANDIPEAVVDPVARTGDMWLLGDHRLLCGDSTSPADVARLMAGETAALCFTSPPYAQQRDYATGGIGDWDALMRGVCGGLPMADDGQILVNLGLVHRNGEWQPYWTDWIAWMREQGGKRFGWYIWDQGPGLPGDWNGRLAPSFEFVFHFCRKPRKPNKIVECAHAGEKLGGRGLRMKDGSIKEKTGAGQDINDYRVPDSCIRVMRHKGGLGDAGSPLPNAPARWPMTTGPIGAKPGHYFPAMSPMSGTPPSTPPR